ncbi:hypothetical protein LINGRAHAP2_LOCUS5149 [Linum grandiflorum]
MIISWNCRGRGQSSIIHQLQELLYKHCPSIVLLIETKQHRNAMEKVRRKMKFSNAAYVDLIQLSGGLALWWTHDTNIVILK